MHLAPYKDLPDSEFLQRADEFFLASDDPSKFLADPKDYKSKENFSKAGPSDSDNDMSMMLNNMSNQYNSLFSEYQKLLTVHNKQSMGVSNDNSTSKSTRSGLCYFHKKYRSSAQKCRKPCSWKRQNKHRQIFDPFILALNFVSYQRLCISVTV